MEFLREEKKVCNTGMRRYKFLSRGSELGLFLVIDFDEGDIIRQPCTLNKNVLCFQFQGNKDRD